MCTSQGEAKRPVCVRVSVGPPNSRAASLPVVCATVCVCARARARIRARGAREPESRPWALSGPGRGRGVVLGQAWGGGRGSARPGSRPLGASGPAMGRVLLNMLLFHCKLEKYNFNLILLFNIAFHWYVALRAPIPLSCLSHCVLSVILKYTRVLVRLFAYKCIISQIVSHDSGTEFLNTRNCLDSWFSICVWAILCPAVGE